MGFSKRFVTLSLLKEKIEKKESIKDVFKADAFIFSDATSSKVFQMLHEGFAEDEIVKFINEQN